MKSYDRVDHYFYLKIKVSKEVNKAVRHKLSFCNNKIHMRTPKSTLYFPIKFKIFN